MRSIDSFQDVRDWRISAPTGASIGFVPTMGALHDGHRMLLRAARANSDLVVASVFVNPTQFGPGEDFAVYPRDPDGDRRLLAEEGVAVAWFGRTDDLYPPGFATRVEVPALAAALCGRQRPGHFAGVSLIVSKLFNAVQPRRAYFGLKDYQQYTIVRRLVRDLNLAIEIVGFPTVRESDGLAMSSRNRRLSAQGRSVAPVLFQALCAAERLYRDGERASRALSLAALRAILAQPSVRLEYLDLVDPDTLSPIGPLVGQRGAVLAVAATVDGVRLIDNIELPGDALRATTRAPAHGDSDDGPA